MKKIKLSIICTAALLLALPFAGCMHADSGDTATQGTTQLTQEVKDEKTVEDDCPDGRCPGSDSNDGECPGDGDCDDKDDKCPDGRCPKDGGDCSDGKCPKRKLPHHRRGKHRKAVTLHCPICGDNN